MKVNKSLSGAINKLRLINFVILTYLFCFALNTYAETNSLKLTNVILYKNSLGYFQMSGKVENNEKLILPAKDTQINDILSSLFVIDLNGGKISSVNYKNSNSNHDILIKIPENHSLTELLKELQGVEIEVDSTAAGTCRGKLIGLEPEYEIIDNKKIATEHKITLLDRNNSIKLIKLSTVKSYKILDKTLQKDLNKLLEISLASKYKHRKNITISTKGKGERNILLGYLINTPVWKTTYRIIFDSEDDNKPLILGYAIAENTTDNDWNDVKISFVSGYPLSFIMPLSKILFIDRPKVPIPGLNFLNVNWNKLSGSELAKKNIKLKRESNSSRSFTKASAPMPAMEIAYSDNLSNFSETGQVAKLAAQSNFADTSNEKNGEMFSYIISTPVTILSGQSAMIPIISDKIEGENIFYYNGDFSENVSKAFAIKNDTNTTFDAGPVTFFQNDGNLGEGIIKENIIPGTQIVIPYAIAETVKLKTELSSTKSNYVKGTIVNGMLKLSYTKTLNTKWIIENRSKEKENFWIDQPKTVNYKLVLPQKPDSEISGNYRFKVALSPEGTTVFDVKESCDTFTTISLAYATPDSLLIYSSKEYISDKDRQTLKELSKLLAEKNALKTSIEQMKNKIKALNTEQDRLRKNVSMLYNSRNAKEQVLKNKWIEKIDKAEEEIDKSQSVINNTNNKLNSINKQIADIINKQ